MVRDLLKYTRRVVALGSETPMRSFGVAVSIPFTPQSPHLVRVIPHEWDDYSVERVRVHESVSDEDIRRALASHDALRVALAEDAHAQRDVPRLIAMVQWQGHYGAGSEEALVWLRDSYTRDERIEPLRRALEHDTPHIRRAGCLVASHLREEAVLDTLIALARDDADDTVAVTAVTALSAMPCDEAFRGMFSVAMNPRRHWTARADAAYMLGQTRRADAIPYLREIAVLCDCERTADCAREVIAHIQQMSQPFWCRLSEPEPRDNGSVGRPIPYNRRWIANQRRRRS
jgi:hypothetical protein